jgi:four helix bundle protein
VANHLAVARIVNFRAWLLKKEKFKQAHSVTKEYPRKELFRLVSQMRRAAVSVPSNIAEGACRKGKVEFKHFLYEASASGVELETQIIIAGNLNYIQKERQIKIQEELTLH